MVDIIIVAVVFALILLALKPTVKYLTGKKSCCGDCAMCNGCGKVPEARKLSKKIIGKKVLYIEGMKCDHCAMEVQTALQKLQGVSAKMSVKNGTATVCYTVFRSEDQFCKAVENAGYKVTKII